MKNAHNDFCVVVDLMWLMRWYWSDLALPTHYWLNISPSSSSGEIYHNTWLKKLGEILLLELEVGAPKLQVCIS